jgi:hypothetical protein
VSAEHAQIERSAGGLVLTHLSGGQVKRASLANELMAFPGSNDAPVPEKLQPHCHWFGEDFANCGERLASEWRR